MPGLPQRIRSLLSPAALWCALTLLLAAGVLFTIADLAAVPIFETRRANQEQQRVIIDPLTGLVSGLSTRTEDTAAFDVAPEEKAPEPDATPSEAPDPKKENATPFAAKLTPASAGEALRLPGAQTALPTVAAGQQSLVRAPAPEVTGKEGAFTVPIHGAGKVTPARLYARSFQLKESQKPLAIVMTDVGFSDETFQALLALPPEIAFAFSPYATDHAKQMEALRNQGREMWTMLPAMGARFPQSDPGPLGLIANISEAEALARLYEVLAATIGSVGVVLPADETFSRQKALWAPVLGQIVDRGLYVLATNPERSLAALGSDTQQTMMRRADAVLDATPGVAFLRSKLAGLADQARSKQGLLVMIGARPQALRLLHDWLQENPLGEDVVLAPASALLAAPEPPVPPPAEEGGHGGGEAEEGGGHGEEEAASGGH